ncbi:MULTISPECIES: hypothetical protein [Polycladomyces]|jgi:hypothetical protein|uniref:Uncharacterized protein n=2 Tax=Polycladomyces TaxID=1348505 RepID=A0A8D5ZMC3_9BACL|nr:MULTISPECIES: hypothetical protein [Polycladomyces]MDN4592563.1 hypothetical protein [Polycladomyces subterraneus]BCU83399.1 hypothetical protein JIR001_31820 [Polycladomyces abyssicola]
MERGELDKQREQMIVERLKRMGIKVEPKGNKKRTPDFSAIIGHPQPQWVIK